MPGLRKLAQFLSLQKGISAHVTKLVELRQQWVRCVESPLRDHAAPANYANGCLVVHAKSSAWACQLRHRERALLKRLREDAYFKDLTQIKIRTKPDLVP